MTPLRPQGAILQPQGHAQTPAPQQAQAAAPRAAPEPARGAPPLARLASLRLAASGSEAICDALAHPELSGPLTLALLRDAAVPPAPEAPRWQRLAWCRETSFFVLPGVHRLQARADMQAPRPEQRAHQAGLARAERALRGAVSATVCAMHDALEQDEHELMAAHYDAVEDLQRQRLDDRRARRGKACLHRHARAPAAVPAIER